MKRLFVCLLTAAILCCPLASLAETGVTEVSATVTDMRIMGAFRDGKFVATGVAIYFTDEDETTYKLLSDKFYPDRKVTVSGGENEGFVITVAGDDAEENDIVYRYDNTYTLQIAEDEIIKVEPLAQGVDAVVSEFIFSIKNDAVSGMPTADAKGVVLKDENGNEYQLLFREYFSYNTISIGGAVVFSSPTTVTAKDTYCVTLSGGGMEQAIEFMLGSAFFIRVENGEIAALQVR